MKETFENERRKVAFTACDAYEFWSRVSAAVSLFGK